MTRQGRPPKDDTDDLREIAEAVEARGLTFRQACRLVHEIRCRDEPLDIYTARMYAKRTRTHEEDLPVEEALDEEETRDPPAPGGGFGP